MRIVDADAHLVEGGEFIVEPAAAHPEKVRLPGAGEGVGALIRLGA